MSIPRQDDSPTKGMAGGPNRPIDDSDVPDAFAHAALSRTMIGIAQIAPDGRWLSVNVALCDLLGRSREALLGTDFRSITHSDDLGTDLDLMARFAAGKRDAARFEKRFVAPDGRTIWADVQVAPLLGEQGLEHYLVTMLDITERKLAETERDRLHRRLEMALEGGGLGEWTLDVRTGHAERTLRHDQIFGYEELLDDWTLERAEAHFHPDDRGTVVAAYERMLTHGEDWNFEARIRLRGDGPLRWVWARGMIVERDRDGAPLRVSGVVQDITERKRQEAGNRLLADLVAPLSTLADYRGTLQNVADLVVPFLADWCLVDVADDTGQPRRVASSHAVPAMTDLVNRLRLDYVAIGASVAGQVLARRETRRLVGAAEVERGLPLCDREQLAALRTLEPHGFLGVPLVIRDRAVGTMAFFSGPSGRAFTDADVELAERIADRVSVALENARLYRSVRLADERKDVYLATLSHELRNPLGAISNGLGLLRPNCADEESHWAFGMIERQMGNLTHLLDDLLDISRITQGKVRLERAPVQLDAVIKDSISAVSARLNEKRHRFVTDLGASGVVLDADAARLEQIVVNLLSNAIRYTDPGGTITLATALEEGAVSISVADTGDGILADDIDNVFDLFTQFDREGRDGAVGLGLGLTLVQQLVELHGGSVTASSEGPRRGSRFTVRLPPTPPGASPGTEPAKVATATAIPASVAPRGAAPELDILLVDDNVDALDAMVRFLERAGHRVRSAGDGGAALAAVAERRPDLMLLDIGLPDISGHDVARAIRENPDNGSIRLIALTGYGRARDRALSREVGFDEHLVKPLRLAALAELLDAPRTAR